MEEHSVYLLLQGGDHSEELFLAGWWWLTEGRRWRCFPFDVVVVVVKTWCVVVVMVMVMRTRILTRYRIVLDPG